MLAQEQME